MTQKDALEQALKDLGGRAHLQDIYPVAIKYITHKEGSKIYDSLRGCIHDKRRFRPSPDKPQGWYELLSFQEEVAALKKENEELKESNKRLMSIPKEAEFVEKFLEEIMNEYRTHTCGQLRASDIGQQVRLAGWIHRKRNLGNLCFVDLRDHYGITQCVFDSSSDLFEQIENIRVESVVGFDGEVVARESVNKNMPTGDVEIKVSKVTIYSEADVLPVQVFGECNEPEELRLKYRFLDLRREKIHNNILLRCKVIAEMRRLMTEQGFNEYQTPILTASSPEGARDFLVPSRLNPGKFYALP